MILNPIRKVLSSMAKHQVRARLMGGQACILYGAAEFSRGVDFAILASPGNLSQLKSALEELKAEVIAVPPFEPDFLHGGHAIHFRCSHPEAAGLRVDVMTRMRGVDDFPALWRRRVTLRDDDGFEYQVMSLADLVQAKKTQRDKDWPMIRRLIESDYFAGRHDPNPSQIKFWLLELRSPELLVELVARQRKASRALEKTRPLLRSADLGDQAALTKALSDEQLAEREADRLYWEPLRKELEQLRRNRPPRHTA